MCIYIYIYIYSRCSISPNVSIGILSITIHLYKMYPLFLLWKVRYDFDNQFCIVDRTETVDPAVYPRHFCELLMSQCFRSNIIEQGLSFLYTWARKIFVLVAFAASLREGDRSSGYKKDSRRKNMDFALANAQYFLPTIVFLFYYSYLPYKMSMFMNGQEIFCITILNY